MRGCTHTRVHRYTHTWVHRFAGILSMLRTDSLSQKSASNTVLCSPPHCVYRSVRIMAVKAAYASIAVALVRAQRGRGFT